MLVTFCPYIDTSSWLGVRLATSIGILASHGRKYSDLTEKKNQSRSGLQEDNNDLMTPSNETVEKVECFRLPGQTRVYSFFMYHAQ